MGNYLNENVIIILKNYFKEKLNFNRFNVILKFDYLK